MDSFPGLYQRREREGGIERRGKEDKAGTRNSDGWSGILKVIGRRFCLCSSSPSKEHWKLLPWLVLPQQGPAGGGDCYCVGLLDLRTGTHVPVSVPVPAPREGPQVSSWSYIGSSHGWLILGDPSTNSLWLFNPLCYNTNTGALRPDSSSSNSSFIISLPDPNTTGVDSLPPKLPTRVFLSSPPPSHSHFLSSSAQYPPLLCKPVDRTCRVFALYDKAIAFCTLEAHSIPSSPLEWKLLRPSPTYLALQRDAFFDGIWLITLSSDKDRGIIVQGWDFCDLPARDPWVTFTYKYCIEEHMDRFQMTLMHERWCRPKAYLTVWSPFKGCDECFTLLIVVRYVAPHITEDGIFDLTILDDEEEERLNGLRHKTLAFEVLSYNHGINCLERVYSLGNQALFLGGNQSFALPIVDEDHPFRSNCIYFTDEYGGHSSSGTSHDCGVFDMVDQTIRPLRHFDFANVHPHPIWILPSSTRPC